MRIFVKMTRRDLPSGEEETVFAGPALLNGSRLLYMEKDGQAKQSVEMTEEKIILERKAEVSSRTVLYEGRPGECRVSSPYGDMLFHSELHCFEKTDDRWLVRYRLYSETGTVTDQEIVWKLKKLN